MEERLNEDDASKPAVEEVEVLVWDAGDQREDAFTLAEEDGERCEGVGESADAI